MFVDFICVILNCNKVRYLINEFLMPSPGLTERPHVHLECPGRFVLCRCPPECLGNVLRVHVLAPLLSTCPDHAVNDGVENMNTLSEREILTFT